MLLEPRQGSAMAGGICDMSIKEFDNSRRQIVCWLPRCSAVNETDVSAARAELQLNGIR